MRHSEHAVEAFWVAIEATRFMVPLLGGCYFLGGVALWFRTAPLGLALLSPPMVIIILFDILLAKKAILLWQFRSAFNPLWSFPTQAAATVWQKGATVTAVGL